MSALLLLVVFVNRADAGGATTTSLVRAARQVLGPSAQIELRPYDSVPSDDELATASSSGDAVAEIVWQDTPHRHAALRCYLGSEQRVITREIAFSDVDAPDERGRMLGFALASLLPDAPAHVPSPLAPQGTPSAPSAPSASSPAPSALTPPAAPARPMAAIDAIALGATGSGGGLGVGIRARWFFHPQLGLSLGLATRRGEIPEAHAFADTKLASLGLTFRYTRAADAAFSLGGRVDYLFTSHEVGRFPAQSGPAERSRRFVSGADLFVEADWNITGSAALLANAGAEVSFSDDAILDGRELAELPPFRGVIELGVRARF